MHLLRLALVSGAIAVSAQASLAQNAVASPAPVPSHAIADSWHNLSVIAPHAHLHVAADHGGATCYFIAVDDESLTCGHHNGSDKGRHVFPRSEVKSVKLTRYGISALGGAGIGAGVGVIVGFAGTQSKDDWLDLNAAVRGACAVAGGLLGAGVGAATDMFRGPTVYRRVRTK